MKVWKADDWNRLRIRCTGGELPVIETWVNDLKVCRFTATTTHPKYDKAKALKVVQPTGSIGLQVHGGKKTGKPASECSGKTAREETRLRLPTCV